MQPKNFLLRRTLLVAGLTSISRFLGLFRDVLLANYFGASAESDAFLVAFRIPNFFRRLFAEGAFSQAFIPVLSEYKYKKKPQETQTLINAVAGTFGCILLLVTILGILAAPILIYIFAPGFQETEKILLASHMLCITFPYLFFIALTAFAAGILNTYDQFAIPAMTPILLNLSLIGSLLYLTAWIEPSIVALAWGVLIAGILQLGLQIPFLSHQNLLPKPQWDWHHSGVKKIRDLMLPAIFSGSVMQISFLIDSLLASFLQTGSISWLYYADRFVELPLGMFGVAIASVILPKLSECHASKNHNEFSNTLNWGIRLVILLGLPATAALIVLAELMLGTLLGHGRMDAYDIIMTAKSLQAFSLGLIAFMLIKVLVSGFFAQKNTKLPMKIAMQALLLNVVLNLVLMGPLAHVGLALSTSLSAMLNAGLLFHHIKKQALYQSAQWSRLMIQISLASIVMVVSLIGYRPDLSEWLSWSMTMQMIQLCILIVMGVFIYFLVLRVLGFRLKDCIKL